MNFKMIAMLSVAALMMSACSHKHHKSACGGCAKAEAQKDCSGKDCSGGECSLEDKKKCAEGKQEAEKAAK
jgi:hypothetical protein